MTLTADQVRALDEIHKYIPALALDRTGFKSMGLGTAVKSLQGGIDSTVKSALQTAAVAAAAATTSAASAATAVAVVATPDGTYSANEQTNLVDLNTAVNALIVDVADIRTKFNQAVTDIGVIRTRYNALQAAIDAL